jgi:hypothetical protein
LQFVTMGDLSGALAVAFMLGGLMAWERRKRWPAAFLLAAAVLTREPMMLAVAAVSVEEGVRWWRAHHSPGALRRAVKAVWPVLATSITVFLAWHIYSQMRLGNSTLPSESAFKLPLVGLTNEVAKTLEGGLTLTGIWDLAYLAGIFAGIAAAFALIRRAITAPAIAAVLFSLVMLVLPFGTDWGYARESAPLFAVLLLGSLGQRTRPAITVCKAVSLLGALLPLMVG